MNSRNPQQIPRHPRPKTTEPHIFRIHCTIPRTIRGPPNAPLKSLHPCKSKQRRIVHFALGCRHLERHRSISDDHWSPISIWRSSSATSRFGVRLGTPRRSSFRESGGVVRWNENKQSRSRNRVILGRIDPGLNSAPELFIIQGLVEFFTMCT
jgi:hypothetical protein